MPEVIGAIARNGCKEDDKSQYAMKINFFMIFEYAATSIINSISPLVLRLQLVQNGNSARCTTIGRHIWLSVTSG